MSEIIEHFWRSFEQKYRILEMAKTANSAVYDDLLEQIQKIERGLFFEFCIGDKENELVITADGNKRLFDLVDEIVLAAPQIDGWRIWALKPKLGFPEFVEWEGLRIKLADVVFDPLFKDERNHLGLRLLVPGIGADEIDDAHNALLRAIDHGLGERDFAERIQYTEAAPLPEGEMADKYIPLADLEKFVEWWRKRNPV